MSEKTLTYEERDDFQNLHLTQQGIKRALTAENERLQDELRAATEELHYLKMKLAEDTGEVARLSMVRGVFKRRGINWEDDCDWVAVIAHVLDTGKERCEAAERKCDALKQRVVRWQRAIEGLTPGGSEFADDPERCAAFVRRNSYMEMFKQNKDLKQRVERLEMALQDIANMPSREGRAMPRRIANEALAQSATTPSPTKPADQSAQEPLRHCGVCNDTGHYLDYEMAGIGGDPNFPTPCRCDAGKRWAEQQEPTK